MSKKRYVQVGLGGRSRMFTKAILGDFAPLAELTAICDTNQGRMDLFNREITGDGHSAVATYKADQFEKMVAEKKPDVVIVTTGPDATHSDYICRAMELGCDVVTEKPMTTDEVRCRRILETQKKTGRNVQVTFNYRYSPPRSQVKEIIQAGEIGDVLSVDFAWMLDTRHGADYFRRWHRWRKNSGSLLVHKATHHFDLVNWWIDDAPEEVFCHGTRLFYTPETAKQRGLEGHGERCLTCGVKDKCRFYLDITKDDFKDLYYDCEKEDGYFRDRCVFGEEIDIYDNMSVSVKYRRGAVLNYLLHAYSPYEGYRIAFNGTKGRLEHHACENTYISGDGKIPGELNKGDTSITLIREFSSPEAIEVRTGSGGHGGGDPILLADVFDPNAPKDPLKRKAGTRDGAYSILVGVAAYHSIDEDKPVHIDSLLNGETL
ncbi:MAG: Gfo/Idh/MocA family oxidoreductase [Phycisphaerae bacterium]|nr:Gfo/Idh/MocA family oxidoreductase [Phycisphaerae bacterium]